MFLKLYCVTFIPIDKQRKELKWSGVVFSLNKGDNVAIHNVFGKIK